MHGRTATNHMESQGVTTQRMAGGRTLTLKETERVRAALVRLRQDFPTQRAMADKLGVSQQVISHVLTGNPAGLALARRLADFQGVSVEDMLGGGASIENTALRGRAGFVEALEVAQRRWPSLARALARVGDMRNAQAPDEITPEYLYDLASLNVKYRPVAESETEAARAEIAAERAKRSK